MKSKSKLVQSLDIADGDDLVKWIMHKTPNIRLALNRVILQGWSYKAAAEPLGITKCAIYEHLIDIYKRKFGVEYADRNKNRN
jgi:hypothetical protein